MAFIGDNKEQKCALVEGAKALPALLQLGKNTIADHQRSNQKPPPR